MAIKLNNIYKNITDLLFNGIVAVENFHGFTFETEKREAIPAGGGIITNKSFMSSRAIWMNVLMNYILEFWKKKSVILIFRSCACSFNNQYNVSPTHWVMTIHLSPHGTLDQSNLIRWGGYKAALLLQWRGHITIHLVYQSVPLSLILLCRLLHLHCVAKTQGTQKQLLPLLITHGNGLLQLKRTVNCVWIKLCLNVQFSMNSFKLIN